MPPLAGRRAALLFAAAAFVGCRRPTVGSGVVATAERSPGAFAEVELRGDFDVDIQLGRERHHLTLELDDNLVELAHTETNGRRLIVEFDTAARPKLRPRLRIEAPDLVLVRCIGTVDIRASGVRNARFQIDLRGAGSATAVGSTQKLKVFVDGSGRVHLESLAIEEALVHVSGSGSADIGAPKHLEAELHGTATVTYQGEPTLESTVRDASTLSKRP